MQWQKLWGTGLEEPIPQKQGGRQRHRGQLPLPVLQSPCQRLRGQAQPRSGWPRRAWPWKRRLRARNSAPLLRPASGLLGLRRGWHPGEGFQACWEFQAIESCPLPLPSSVLLRKAPQQPRDCLGKASLDLGFQTTQLLARRR